MSVSLWRFTSPMRAMGPQKQHFVTTQALIPQSSIQTLCLSDTRILLWITELASDSCLLSTTPRSDPCSWRLDSGTVLRLGPLCGCSIFSAAPGLSVMEGKTEIWTAVLQQSFVGPISSHLVGDATCTSALWETSVGMKQRTYARSSMVIWSVSTHSRSGQS